VASSLDENVIAIGLQWSAVRRPRTRSGAPRLQTQGCGTLLAVMDSAPDADDRADWRR